MSLLKYLERIKRIDALVRNKSTGTPDEFAEKLGISKSMLMVNLVDLKKAGVPIEYSIMQRSYVYNIDYILSMDNLLNKKEVNSIKGGVHYYSVSYTELITEQYKLNQNSFSFQYH